MCTASRCGGRAIRDIGCRVKGVGIDQNFLEDVHLLSILLLLVLGGEHRLGPDLLVFSKTVGYRHASIEPGVAALTRLAEENGLSVLATEDAAMFTEAVPRARVVIFLNTTLDVLEDSQQGTLEEFVRNGGGFVGVHSAADTEYDWPWYGQLVGAYFDGHPNDPGVREGRIHVVDTTHAATRCLPKLWVRTDEWYDYRYVNKAVNVLLHADELSYKRPSEQPSAEAHPISWYHELEGGRMFYTGFGHTSESFVEPLYLEHLWGGVRYALGESPQP